MLVESLKYHFYKIPISLCQVCGHIGGRCERRHNGGLVPHISKFLPEGINPNLLVCQHKRTGPIFSPHRSVESGLWLSANSLSPNVNTAIRTVFTDKTPWISANVCSKCKTGPLHHCTTCSDFTYLLHLHLVLTGLKLLIFGSAQQHQLLTVALASLTESEEEAGLWFHSSLSADGADFFFCGDWWSRSVNPTVQQTKAEEFLPEANCDTHMLTPQQQTHTTM